MINLDKYSRTELFQWLSQFCQTFRDKVDPLLEECKEIMKSSIEDCQKRKAEWEANVQALAPSMAQSEPENSEKNSGAIDGCQQRSCSASVLGKGEGVN